VLRMMLLKHVRDWSYEVLTREVRANLVYRVLSVSLRRGRAVGDFFRESVHSNMRRTVRLRRGFVKARLAGKGQSELGSGHRQDSSAVLRVFTVVAN
jgi:hypothetical protein